MKLTFAFTQIINYKHKNIYD